MEETRAEERDKTMRKRDSMVKIKIDTANESCQFQLKRNPIFPIPGVYAVHVCLC